MSDRKTNMTMAAAEATKALTALEIDLLRKDVAFWIEQSDIWKRVANDERDATDRLRAVIENAPHDRDASCGFGVDPRDISNCTCWKADAL